MSHSIPVRQVESAPFVSRLARVAETDAHEGPVYVAGEDALYFTSRDGVIKRLALDSGSVSVVRAEANRANGMTLGLDDRLVVCEQGTLTDQARISRVDPATGAAQTVVDQWRGLRLNSPNDVVVPSDGSIWFTDPTYGSLHGFRPAPEIGDYVYRHDPETGTTSVVAKLEGPNGLAFSPDEKYLYVGNWDPQSKVVMRYEIDETGAAVGGSVFYDMTDAPGEDALDGLKVDVEGNLYACGPGGIWVLSPQGEKLGLLHLPEEPHNLACGDDDGRTLYVTALTSIYRVRLNIAGIRPR
jgi:gluconolactonase